MYEYGLQLYSVRDITDKDLLGAIQKVSEMGYTGMEFAGFFGNSAKDVKACMDRCGAKAWGTHTGVDQLTDEKLMDTIAYHKEIGCQLCIIPWANHNNLEALKALAALIEKVQPVMKAHGITLAYHNHSSELTPNEDGLIALDWLVENTSIAVELDTFWAYSAGVDPIAKMDELGSRLVAVHLKDGVRGGEGDPLGQGQAPVKAVRDYALAHHLPIVVESESLTPTGPEEVKVCIEYLKSLEE